MHFSKTYTQLLESLPPELQKNAVQYRQLKKIINQIVKELTSLGLSPDLLHKFLYARRERSIVSPETYKADDFSSSPSVNGRVTDYGHIYANASPRIVYEFNEASSKIEPRLRISLKSFEELYDLLNSGAREEGIHMENAENRGADLSSPNDGSGVTNRSESGETNPHTTLGKSLLWKLQKANLESQVTMDENNYSVDHEIFIPLASDSQFFELLYNTLERMSSHLKTIEAGFMTSLTTLAGIIGNSARPTSSINTVLGRNFRALSPLRDNAGTINIQRGKISKSDLYSWREIFKIYVEAEVFESVNEQDRGERSVEESERRLQLFTTQVTQRGLAARTEFKSKESRLALEAFLQLNVLILNIKKFQLANSEATRKILKKHTKRTALPLLSPSEISLNIAPLQLALSPRVRSSPLPRILVQAIGEILLPIIPHLDDYACLICTSIAFKPIRLDCGHLFCVRCLVKMQKLGKNDCPMCRSPSVLVANRSNVDWALMNFMQDWFPIEAKEKLKANEKEAIAEELKGYGIDPNTPCVIM